MKPDRFSTVAADDGTPLAVRESGPRTAPVTVIFVHGFSLHMESWAPQRIRLERAWRGRARMVFFDHRGHGESGEAPPSTYTIRQLGQDLDAVVRAVVPDGPLVLVGHSMGGMAVLSYVAQQSATVLDRVIGVGLVSTAANAVASYGIARVLNTPAIACLRTFSEHTPRLMQNSWTMSRRLLSPMIGTTCARAPLATVRAANVSYQMIHHTPASTLVTFLSEFKRYDEWPALSTLGATPVAIVCGTHDVVTPIAHSKRLASELPLAELIAIPGGRHLVQFEHADIVTECLDRLLHRAQATLLASPTAAVSISA